ncbi:MAG TPA: histidine kinase, partial [Pseudoxanthomonas sp.]|nr:histidine kinase [Pseudoxanthomonas sp.]
MTSPRQDYPLSNALPSDVLVGGNAVWSRYRRYPVFSLHWLLGRSAIFAAVLLFVAVMIGTGTGLAMQDWWVGVRIGMTEWVAFMLMATMGPALATWVRHRRWPVPRERKAVVIAVLLGMLISFFVDRLASGYIEELIRPWTAARGIAPVPQMGALAKAVGLAMNLALLIVVYGLFGGGLSLRAYFSERQRWDRHNSRQQLDAAHVEARDADLRLGVLQAQVEPHFLFNTLASVRALVRQDPAQAENTLDALVDFLRASIPKLRDGESKLHSTLGQQLDLCRSYLALMQVRMGGRLSYAVEADPALRAAAFPPSILITLVENAIKHGIEPKPGPGRVRIFASLHEGRLL